MTRLTVGVTVVFCIAILGATGYMVYGIIQLEKSPEMAAQREQNEAANIQAWADRIGKNTKFIRIHSTNPPTCFAGIPHNMNVTAMPDCERIPKHLIIEATVTK